MQTRIEQSKKTNKIWHIIIESESEKPGKIYQIKLPYLDPDEASKDHEKLLEVYEKTKEEQAEATEHDIYKITVKIFCNGYYRHGWSERMERLVNIKAAAPRETTV